MLIIFFVSTSIHLYASWIQNKPLRNKSKPFIILALIGYYCLTVDEIMVTVVLALIFSWIGDVFLIPNGVKWFTIGGISFEISHIFFILSYYQSVNFNKIDLYVAIALALFYAITASIVFKGLKPHLPKALFYPMYMYLLVNGGMNCFAWYRFLTNMDLGGIITVIGACLFFISDSTLFYVRFKKNSRVKTHFAVMLTYSIGELLIVLGLILG